MKDKIYWYGEQKVCPQCGSNWKGKYSFMLFCNVLNPPGVFGSINWCMCKYCEGMWESVTGEEIIRPSDSKLLTGGQKIITPCKNPKEFLKTWYKRHSEAMSKMNNKNI